MYFVKWLFFNFSQLFCETRDKKGVIIWFHPREAGTITKAVGVTALCFRESFSRFRFRMKPLCPSFKPELLIKIGLTKNLSDEGKKGPLG